MNGMGPRFKPLSPEEMSEAQRNIRFNTSLPPRLSEFAILITARYWSSQYEWFAHAPLAAKGGLASSVISELQNGKRPSGMSEDETAVYDFCNELHTTKGVSDATYTRALDRVGERGIVDLIGVSGYYTLVSMVLNVDRHSLPAGTPAPLPPLSPKPGERRQN